MASESIPLFLTAEALYYFNGIRGKPDDRGRPTWAFRPGWYRFKGIALDYRTKQERLVYVGLNKWDLGQWFVAGLADWARDMQGPYSNEEVKGASNATTPAKGIDGSVS